MIKAVAFDFGNTLVATGRVLNLSDLYSEAIAAVLSSIGLEVQLLSMLNKMRDKTDAMIQSLGEAVARRESLDLTIIYNAIANWYQYT